MPRENFPRRFLRSDEGKENVSRTAVTYPLALFLSFSLLKKVSQIGQRGEGHTHKKRVST